MAEAPVVEKVAMQAKKICCETGNTVFSKAELTRRDPKAAEV
jgi:hypothetical protein